MLEVPGMPLERLKFLALPDAEQALCDGVLRSRPLGPLTFVGEFMLMSKAETRAMATALVGFIESEQPVDPDELGPVPDPITDETLCGLIVVLDAMVAKICVPKTSNQRLRLALYEHSLVAARQLLNLRRAGAIRAELEQTVGALEAKVKALGAALGIGGAS